MLDPYARHEEIDQIVMDGMNNLRSAGKELDVAEIVIQAAEESLIALGGWTKFSTTAKEAGLSQDTMITLHMIYKLMKVAADEVAKELTGV